MSDYELQIVTAIKRFKRVEGLTTNALAAKLGMTASSLSSKLAGARAFKVTELHELALLGVEIPAFGVRHE